MKLFVALFIACGLFISVFAFTVSAQGEQKYGLQNSSKTWTVLVGGEAEVEQQENGPAGAWQFMRFYPENITINAGDTIVWKLASAEPHTVTFPKAGDVFPELFNPEGGSSQRMLFNPLAVRAQGSLIYDGMSLAGSGQLDAKPQFPREYKLTFTNQGTYEYFCAFHSMMKGNVTVQPAGTPYPETQEQIDAKAASLLAADTRAAIESEPIAKQVSTSRGPSGTTIYRVNMGYGDGRIAWMRYAPEDLTITAGDTVEWIQQDAETPHTVTFTSGGKDPEYFLEEGDKLILNPVVMEPASGRVYSGKGYFNSGFIWGSSVPTPGSRTYTLTFDTPGAYKYVCVTHAEMGMHGQITVLPKVVSSSRGFSSQGQKPKKKKQGDNNHRSNNQRG